MGDEMPIWFLYSPTNIFKLAKASIIMKKLKAIILIIILILFALVIFFILNYSSITGKSISPTDQYTFTKAICNETNFCQDYEITCKQNKTIKMIPITGAFVQHNPDWEDSRTKQETENICQ